MKNQTPGAEIHPDWYFDVPVMHSLILGSFPPHESKRDFPFYYPNKQNNFWKILALLHGVELNYFSGDKAVYERQRIMLDLKLGVQNMGKEIIRLGTSARDTDISITKYQDIVSIINHHPELQRIIIAGYSAESSAYYSFLNYAKLYQLSVYLPSSVKPKSQFTININQRKVKCVIVNSTSTAARIKLSVLAEQFKYALHV